MLTPMPGLPVDREAVERWLAEFGPRLRAIVRSRCPRELGIEPDEVEQEVRIRVWQALGEHPIDHPASYLYRAAMNVIVDLLRRRRARPDRDGDALDTLTQHPVDAGLEPAAVAADGEFAAAVRAAVRALPERRQRPVQLHLQGFGFAEVAQLLGLTDATARNLIYRGMEGLRERLRAGGWP